MVTIGGLFSGIGGLELGLEAATGGCTVFQAESDPYARAVLRSHWPLVPCFEDVREINATTAPGVDIICGGFPCQPHSSAGKRGGTSDERWLWPEFLRVVDSIQPKAVFIENVPGLRTSGLKDVLRGLADGGYDAEWGCFRACEIGAPHPRARLFILAHANRKLGSPRDWVLPEYDRKGTLLTGYHRAVHEHHWTTPIAGLRGVADGVPGRVDRLRCLGNSVVPQQAALAFRELSGRL